MVFICPSIIQRTVLNKGCNECTVIYKPILIFPGIGRLAGLLLIKSSVGAESSSALGRDSHFPLLQVSPSSPTEATQNYTTSKGCSNPSSSEVGSSKRAEYWTYPYLTSDCPQTCSPSTVLAWLGLPFHWPTGTLASTPDSEHTSMRWPPCSLVGVKVLCDAFATLLGCKGLVPAHILVEIVPLVIRNCFKCIIDRSLTSMECQKKANKEIQSD